MELTNQHVVLNFRQLAHLKQKIVNLRSDVEHSGMYPSTDFEIRFISERQEILKRIGEVIDAIHTLSGSSTIWEEDFEEQDRLSKGG